MSAPTPAYKGKRLSLKALAARLAVFRELNAGDYSLLRWVALCALVLVGTGVMLLCGAFTTAGEWQITLLLGRPFYMEAVDVQTSLLEPHAIFALCIALTLYLSAVLVREHRVAVRSTVCFFAMVAALLPGLICILWNGVFYVAPLLFCIVLLWVLTLFPFFRKPVS